MDLARLRATATSRATELREAVENRIVPLQVRMRETWADPPRVSAWVPLFLLAVAVAVVPVALWVKGRSVDREWRAKIAASSAAVRAIVEKEGEDALASDAAIIKALGETDANLSKAEKELRTVRGPDNCPLIPRRCLGGVRGQ